SSRAAFLPVPSVAMPALPFSPVKFSGLIERDLALERLASDSIPEKSAMRDRRTGARELRQMSGRSSCRAEQARLDRSLALPGCQKFSRSAYAGACEGP